MFNKKWSFLISLVDQALVSGGNFFTTLLGARYLTVENQGKLGYLFSAYLAASILSQVAIYQVASVEASKTENSYFFFIQFIQLLISISGTIVLSLALFISGLDSGWKITISEYLVIIFFLFLQQQSDFLRRGAYIFSNNVVSLASSIIIYPTRLLGLFLIKPTNIFLFVGILALTALLPAIKSIIDLFSINKRLIDIRKYFNPHFSKAKWLILGGPFTWLWCNLPIFILGLQGNLMFVGIITTLRSITNAGNVLLEILETYVSASAGKLFSTDEAAYIRLLKTTFYSGLFIWLIGLCIIYLFGEDLLGGLLSNQYQEHLLLLKILWVGVLSIFLYRLSSVRTRTEGKTNAIFLSLVIGTIISSMVSFALIPKFNMYGASIAIGISPLFMWMIQEINIKINYKTRTNTPSKGLRI